MNIYLIERKCPRTGFIERIYYEGSLRNKPTKWKVVMNKTQ